jgi:hypothetical protein
MEPARMIGGSGFLRWHPLNIKGARAKETYATRPFVA